MSECFNCSGPGTWIFFDEGKQHSYCCDTCRRNYYVVCTASQARRMFCLGREDLHGLPFCNMVNKHLYQTRHLREKALEKFGSFQAMKDYRSKLDTHRDIRQRLKDIQFRYKSHMSPLEYTAWSNLVNVYMSEGVSLERIETMIIQGLVQLNQSPS